MAEPKIVVCPQCGKKYKVSAEADVASFACKQCGATVWLDGKPKSPSSGRRKTSGKKASGRKAGAKRSGGRAAARGGAAPRGKATARGGQRRGRARQEEPEDEEGGRGRGRYEKKPDNTTNIILAVGGLIVLVGAIAFFAMQGDDEKPDTGEEMASGKSGGENAGNEDGGGMGDKPVLDDTSSGKADTPAANSGDETPEVTEKPVADEPKKLKKEPAKYKINKQGKKVRLSRWNPPDDIGHLESTSAEKRKEIDDLITLMFDATAGRDGMDAKRKLIQMDKAAFLPLLAMIVSVKKDLKWDRSIDDNQLMSSVRMADEVLREMDGYMEAKSIGKIRPGTDEEYYGYLVRMYYKRWVTELSKMDKMPGPYDLSAEYENEGEDED